MADYGATGDGEAAAFGAFFPTPTKGGIVADSHCYIPPGIISSYIKQFTREEMAAMLNLLIRGMGEYHNYMSIKFADKAGASLGDLATSGTT